MIRIAYVIPSLSMGGTEWQLYLLMRGLVREHRISVICTHHDGALGGDARRLGATVHLAGGIGGGWDPRQKGRIAKALRAHRPHVVHSFMFGFDLWTCQAAREAGVPVVISSRRQLATWKKRRHIWMQKQANRFVQAIVANSQAVADFAIRQEGADPALFHIIPNGLEVKEFISVSDVPHIRARYRLPPEVRIIGMVANLTPVKDHALFLDMAAALLKRRQDLHFFLVGGGPRKRWIERRAYDLGIEERLNIVTTVGERADLYKMFDVSVLTSKTEGFPNVVMEAMAAGTPVVAGDVGGIPEILRDGETGRLVSSRDPEQFADAVAWFLDHPAEGRVMTERAKQHVLANYPVEAMVERHKTLYLDLLAKSIERKGV